jgi:hypothetical protein
MLQDYKYKMNKKEENNIPVFNCAVALCTMRNSLVVISNLTLITSTTTNVRQGDSIKIAHSDTFLWGITFLAFVTKIKSPEK